MTMTMTSGKYDGMFNEIPVQRTRMNNRPCGRAETTFAMARARMQVSRLRRVFRDGRFRTTQVTPDFWIAFTLEQIPELNECWNEGTGMRAIPLARAMIDRVAIHRRRSDATSFSQLHPATVRL